MKLISATVKNFRSVLDSEEFSIGQSTCLVGKNEAGKTAILHAIEGINPVDTVKVCYDKIRDYPRRFLNDYDNRHPDDDAEIILTKWKLDESDVEIVQEVFGDSCLTGKEISISTRYSEATPKYWTVPIDAAVGISFLVESQHFNAAEKAGLAGLKSGKELVAILENKEAATEKQSRLLEQIKSFRNQSVVSHVVDLLKDRVPKILYFSHYDRMSGKISLEQVQRDLASNEVSEGDSVFLDFLDYAGTTVEDLNSLDQFEQHKAKVEAASIQITDRIFEYWSQNRNLEIEFDSHIGRSGDQAPFNTGTVMEARVRNTVHRMSVPFSERSAGFIWFFSFLVRFSQVTKKHDNVIILLDEPGLTLHAAAQADLLRFFKEKLQPSHQLIYTTHSPFMVPPGDLMSVRTVEDIVVDREIKGTKVGDRVLSTDRDTLFPLQGALGFDITQSLFVGKNTLLVEGPSDILYLQAISNELRARKMECLDPRWTICPSGGIDKIMSFVSLFSGNQLNIVVLTDIAKGQKGTLERLRKSEILESARMLTAADFCDQDEADVEDLLGAGVLVAILNAAYELKGKHLLTTKKLMEASDSVRLIKKAEAFFRLLPNTIPELDHFAPSSWLIRNPGLLQGDKPELTETLNTFSKLFERINQFN